MDLTLNDRIVLEDNNLIVKSNALTGVDAYDKVIETIMPMGHKAVILKTIEWTGPDSPYDYLGYRYPANCPVPVPPAWDVYDLDVTMNIMGKSARQQAESQKTIIAAEPAGKKAAEAVLRGNHMDVMTVKGMENVKQFNFGGVPNENYGWMQWAEGQFQKAGATTSDIVSGKGPTSGTLGQDQMVYSNASRMISMSASLDIRGFGSIP